MVIIKNNTPGEEVEISTSKKVGRANSRDIRKAGKKQFFAAESGATLANLKSDGTMMAPEPKKRAKKKSLFKMIKAEKKNKKRQ